MFLKLNNWRCFSEAKIHLPDQPLILCDRNGSGKTSILSAIYSLFTGEAWPETKFSSSLMFDKDYFGLEIMSQPSSWFLNGKISPSGRLITKYEQPDYLDVSFLKMVKLENSANDFLTLEDAKILTYLPTDNLWFFESRTTKLKILDELLSQIYGQKYRNLLKKLAQTNLQKLSLIKNSREFNKQIDEILLFTLSEQIHFLSQEIWQYRQKFFNYLNQHLPKFETWIQTNLQNWQVRWEITNSFGDRQVVDSDFPDPQSPNWHSLWKKEIASETILYGAHRDDFNLISQYLKCQDVFSRGEMRSFVLFVKNLAQDLSSQKKTIWLIDDIFNELDDQREQLIFTEILQKSEWFLATSTQKVLHLPVLHASLDSLTIRD